MHGGLEEVRALFIARRGCGGDCSSGIRAEWGFGARFGAKQANSKNLLCVVVLGRTLVALVLSKLLGKKKNQESKQQTMYFSLDFG